MNTYISSIERETLSEYPLQIQSTGFDMSAMVGDPNKNNKTNSQVKVVDMMENMFSKIGSNDLKSLKAYIHQNKKINRYARAIEYDYDVTPQIYTSNQYGIRQVNPDSTMKKLGMGTSSNSLMNSMMNTNVFYSLPEHSSLYRDQYDVKAGHWPKNENECVVVLSKKGGISDFMLYTLGLRDPSQLDKMLEAFNEEKKVQIQSGKEGYQYKDILGITFKVVDAFSYYQYDSNYHIYKDKSEDSQYIQSLVKKGRDLKIVGIVQPHASSNASMLSMGIYYPQSLIHTTIQRASQSDIVKAQIADKTTNVLTGQKFSDKSQKQIDYSSMFKVDENQLKNAFQFDTSQLQFDSSSLDLSGIQIPQMDLKQIFNQVQIHLSTEETSQLMSSITDGYTRYLQSHPVQEINEMSQVMNRYLQSQRASQIIKKGIEEAIKENGEVKITEEQMQKMMNDLSSDFRDYAKEPLQSMSRALQKSLIEYFQSQNSQQMIQSFVEKVMDENHLEDQLNTILNQYVSQMMSSISASMKQAITKQIATLSSSMSQAFHFHPEAFQKAIQINMSQSELTELMKSMMNTQQATYENNLTQLGYCSFDNPSSISIYPKDFEKKKSVINYLDSYNEKMKKSDDEKVITYTDIVGTLMSSVTDIVDVISYVLIAFVGISLVVSSIMIGVITYISVLERKKEIGILRAIGASKRNISEVFNAETFIVGLLSGLMGIGITLILLIPTNMIIHSVSGQVSINAVLPVSGAVVLILLSIALTLLGGLIPSRKAAKEDPVEALRTD